MEDLESKSYDKFDFRLEDLQILIAKAGQCIVMLVSKDNDFRVQSCLFSVQGKLF